LFRKLADRQWQLEETLTGKISAWTADELSGLYVQRRLVFVRSNLAKRAAQRVDMKAGTAALSLPPSETVMQEKHLPVIKERRAYLLPILGLPSVRSAIAPHIQQVWEKLGRSGMPPSTSTVLRWKRAYLDAERDPASLAPHTALKGNRTVREVARLSEMAAALIDEKYLTEERPTIQDILDLLIAQVNRENKTLPRSMQIARPTRRYIRRMIEKIPAYDRDVARRGKVEADRRYRSSLGQIVAGKPLERAEIDH
ncbi:Integrase catalytic region, partial [mine drainage metagenome]